MKKFLIIALFLISALPVLSVPKTTVTYEIDAEKNAYEHNNLGLIYTEEECYYAAIQEFKIAISLNPKKQSTATYFNNLGLVYMKIGYPELALDCFKNAQTQYSLNFDYYKNLVECYESLGQVHRQLENYKHRSGALDKVMLGLLYEKTGDYKKAITTLDEFTMSEPMLLITPAVKIHIQDIITRYLNK